MPVVDTDATKTSTRSVALLASDAMVEANQAVTVALVALEDDLIARDELDDINRKCDEAVQVLTVSIERWPGALTWADSFATAARIPQVSRASLRL